MSDIQSQLKCARDALVRKRPAKGVAKRDPTLVFWHVYFHPTKKELELKGNPLL